MDNYDKNVFINCPFDDQYDTIFHAILFTVHRCGFILRCSKEFQDTSSIRIENIMKLIDESRYSIHDLSRVTVESQGDLPRFNMPLELGVFMGCSKWGAKKHKQKEYIIIESEQFRFKQFISDISGQDIKSHQNKPESAVTAVRTFLTNKTNDIIPSPSNIWTEYLAFQERLPELCAASGWVVEELTFKEHSSLVTNWLTFTTRQA